MPDAAVAPDAALPDTAVPPDAALSPFGLPDPPLVDVAAWLAAHGVKQRVQETSCFEVAVGSPPSPGLACRAQQGRHDTLLRVYAFADGRADVAWSGIVGTWANWLDLRIAISADGEALVLRDRPGHCESALREADEKARAGIMPELHGIIAHACQARGRYVWRGRAYVPAASAPPK